MWVELIDPFSFFGVLLFLAMFVVVAVCAEDDNAGAALFFFLVWLAVLTLFSTVRPLEFLATNWLPLLMLIPVYLLVGFGWALYRWRRYVRDPANYSAGVTVLDPALSKYRSKIVAWISWWPMSLAWHALSWPRKLATKLYDSTVHVFERVSESARR